MVLGSNNECTPRAKNQKPCHHGQRPQYHNHILSDQLPEKSHLFKLPSFTNITSIQWSLVTHVTKGDEMDTKDPRTQDHDTFVNNHDAMAKNHYGCWLQSHGP